MTYTQTHEETIGNSTMSRIENDSHFFFSFSVLSKISFSVNEMFGVENAK